MNCPVCSSPARLIGKTIDSFDSSAVGVYLCSHCGLKFVPVRDSLKIYDKLYASGKLGYYHDKAKDHLSLEKLVYKDINFAAVAHNLPVRKPLDILDVGCSYGYLTNALKKLGHRVKGIDVASQAIAYAKKTYGNHFEQKEANIVEGSYDMIIAIELIEHLPDPSRFVKKCAELLKPGGNLIITTPNKDFYNRKTVWMTNPPPVHNYWFGKRSMEILAEKAGLKMELLPYHEYLARYDNQNLLVNRFRYQNQRRGVFTYEARKRGPLKSFLRKVILSHPVKGISNFIFSFRPVSRTLAVMMTKN